MFRWSYLIPRAVLVLVIWCGFTFGIDPLLRTALISSGETAAGARVDLCSLTTSLRDGGLRLRDVRVADPKSPMKNLFQFSQASMKIDLDALLRKRLVVTDGQLRELQLGTTRSTSGALESSPQANAEESEAPSVLATQWQRVGSLWLDRFSQRLQADLASEFVSVRIGKELIQRWPAEYAAIEADAAAWKQRVQRLEQAVRELRDQPVRELEYYQQRLAELNQIRTEAPKVRDKFLRLKEQMLADKEAVVRAKERDVQNVREKLWLKQLDAQDLSEYLISEQCGDYVTTLVTWVGRVRGWLNVAGTKPELNVGVGRGVTLAFDSPADQPCLLFESLAIDGSGHFSGKKLRLLGSIRDLSLEPHRHDQPTVVEFTTSGDVELRVRGTFDHRQEQPHEQLLINCPALQIAGHTLGDASKLAVQVAPGAAHLWMQVDLQGDALAGKVIWKQRDVQLTTEVSTGYGGQRLAQHLADATSQIRTVQATLDLAGTLRRPKFDLHSDLGNQLATAFNGAVHREVEFRQQQLMVKLDQAVAEQTERLQTLLADQEAKLLSELKLGEQQLDDLKRQFASQIGLPKGLKSGELFGGKGLLGRRPKLGELLPR